MFGPRLRTNVHPTSGRRRPGSRRGCLSSVIIRPEHETMLE